MTEEQPTPDNIALIRAVGHALYVSRHGPTEVIVWKLDQAERFIDHLRGTGYDIVPQEGATATQESATPQAERSIPKK